MPKILTQKGTDIIPSYVTVHKIPVQLNTLSVTGDNLAPIFNCSTSDYTVLTGSVDVTVTVTIATSDVPVSKVKLDEEKTYVKDQDNVISITVKNSADKNIKAYEVDSVTLPPDEFSYTSKASGSNMIYTYTATYKGTTFATEQKTYYYIIKLPEYHYWDLTNNTNPLYQKTVVILPWIIFPKASFFSQISMIESDIFNIVIALSQGGYHIDLQNSDVHYFKDFNSYLHHLDSVLVQDASKDDTYVVVNNNEGIYVGNEYVITNNLLHDIIRVKNIKTIYDSVKNTLSYEITTEESLKYNYNAGSKFTRSVYYSSKDQTALVGSNYQFVATNGAHHTITALSTGAIVQENAVVGATVLSVNDASGLTAGETYYIAENKLNNIDYQEVTVDSISTDKKSVTLKEPGLTVALAASYTPTFFIKEKMYSSNFVYQTWCNRTDLGRGQAIVKSDGVKSYLVSNDTDSTLSDADIQKLLDEYWTGVTINTSFNEDTMQVTCTKKSTSLLVPGKEYFVTTKDSTSYGRIVVQNFSATSNTTGTITLEKDKTLGITVTPPDSAPSYTLTGNSNKPLYVLEKLPPLVPFQITFWYWSRPTGGASNYGDVSDVYTILTRYDDKAQEDSSKLAGNMRDRCVIYRRIIPYPLNKAYRTKKFLQKNDLNLIMDKDTNYSSIPEIGDMKFWVKSNIFNIFGEDSYGYQIEYPLSLSHAYVKSNLTTFSGKEGLDRFRVYFNRDSSTTLMDQAVLFGTLNTFKDVPNIINCNILASTKSNTTKEKYNLNMLAVKQQSKEDFEIQYDPSQGGYPLIYEDSEGKSTPFNAFSVTKLSLAAKSTVSVPDAGTYQNGSYVNWYINYQGYPDYQNPLIVFPQPNLIIDDSVTTDTGINTVNSKIYVNIVYNCQETQLENKIKKYQYMTNKGFISTSSKSGKVPFEYEIPLQYKEELINSKVNFKLLLQSDAYSSAIRGAVSDANTAFALEPSLIQKVGLTMSGNIPAYEEAYFSGYIYGTVPHVLTGIKSKIHITSYSTTKNAILFEDMLDYVNDVITLDQIKGYNNYTSTGFNSLAGIPGLARIVNKVFLDETTEDETTEDETTEDETTEDETISPFIVNPATEEGYMSWTLGDASDRLIKDNYCVRLFVRNKSILGTAAEKALKDSFIQTYCKEMTEGSGRYELKTRKEIIAYCQDIDSKNYMKTDLQCVREGLKAEQNPPSLVVGYLTKNYSFTEMSGDSYKYYQASATPSLNYNLIDILKNPDQNQCYYHRLVLHSGNFEDNTLYSTLRNHQEHITGKNCRFYKIKLQKSLINEYSSYYEGVIPDSDIEEIPVTTGTPYNPTQISTSGDQIIFWTEDSQDSDIITIRCTFRMYQTSYRCFSRWNNVEMTVSGRNTPRVQGFINKWIY